MKKIHTFSKFFVPAVILSVILIGAGLASVFTKGFNKGLDFAPGQSIELSIADSTPTAEEVADVLKSLDRKIEVKTITNDTGISYQVRTTLEENQEATHALNADSDELNKVESDILAALNAKYGEGKVSEIQKNVITAQYSAKLIKNSIYLVLATLLLIFIYAAFRFRWDFGFAAVVAIVHDAFIMIGFISISGIEFTTTTIAAILTIIGYSINATVVILDRVRSDLKNQELKSIKDVLNKSLSSTLSRSIITTLTTLFAVLSLVYFTTGDIHNFAVALVVGLLSGCYSSIFISSAIISFIRRNWKPTATSNNVYKLS